jgi:prepilin-type N-terminal cleavage/methylation domain-containing protein
MMRINSRKAYTLVEIMIVVAIIAIFIAISVPNYFKSSKTSAKNMCMNNLKQIDGAMEQWALDNQVGEGTVPSLFQQDEIYCYVDDGMPGCPLSGEYTIRSMGSKPQVTCSKEDEGHALPE